MDGQATVARWGDGDRRWFLNAWSTIAVDAAATGGTLDVVTQALPAGYAPPGHRHTARDEVLVVVRGEVHLTCEGQRWLLGPGGVAHIPRGAAHAIAVSLADPADVVFVSSPAGLAGLIGDLGHVVADGDDPRPTAPDLAALAAAGARHDLLLDEPGAAAR
ncbi:cupin domain-containing protein [Euzebya sp.]|uniref:cupin domain-containing protein n=1 Tax=Euzebya sp. TaxID=1971409 RepID=UPI003515CAA0